MKDGVLYRTAAMKGDTYQQLVIPKSIIDIVFKGLHDHPCMMTSDHQGRDRTLLLIKIRFVWLGIDSNIKNRVRLCERCICR